MASISEVRKLYDARAEIPFDGSTYANQVAGDIDLISSFVGRDAIRLCDVGCGTGWHLTAWKNRGLEHAVGIDISAASLTALLQRTTAYNLEAPTLILGDATRWQTSHQFNVVTSLLSCLGSMSRNSDDAYLSALFRLLLPGGALVLSCFCAELAPSLEGTTTLAYSRSKPTSVITSITYHQSHRSLTIAQTTRQPHAQLPTEIFQLYTRDELYAAIIRAGFRTVSVTLTQNLIFAFAKK